MRGLPTSLNVHMHLGHHMLVIFIYCACARSAFFMGRKNENASSGQFLKALLYNSRYTDKQRKSNPAVHLAKLLFKGWHLLSRGLVAKLLAYSHCIC